MKLYAKISASRGGREAVKGDDNILDINLYNGNKKVYYIRYINQGLLIFSISPEGIANIILDNKLEKGKTQKGEMVCEYHGVKNCSRCDIFKN